MGARTHSRRATTVLAALALPLGLLSGLAAAVPAAGAATPTLQQAFNNVGITSAATASAGNFDGTGDSFSAASLAADALTPGRSLLHDGLTVSWPDVAPGQPDNVVADGQTISVSGTGTTLGIAGASGFGPTSGTVTVNYADGTSTAATVTFADWVATSAASGTDLLATTGGWNPGRHDPGQPLVRRRPADRG